MAMFLYSLNIFEVVLHKVDKRLSLRRKLRARFRLQALPSYWKDDCRRHHSVTKCDENYYYIEPSRNLKSSQR